MKCLYSAARVYRIYEQTFCYSFFLSFCLSHNDSIPVFVHSLAAPSLHWLVIILIYTVSQLALLVVEGRGPTVSFENPTVPSIPEGTTAEVCLTITGIVSSSFTVGFEVGSSTALTDAGISIVYFRCI